MLNVRVVGVPLRPTTGPPIGMGESSSEFSEALSIAMASLVFALPAVEDCLPVVEECLPLPAESRVSVASRCFLDVMVGPPVAGPRETGADLEAAGPWLNGPTAGTMISVS